MYTLRQVICFQITSALSGIGIGIAIATIYLKQ